MLERSFQKLKRINNLIGPADYFYTKDIGKQMNVSPGLVNQWLKKSFLQTKENPFPGCKKRVLRDEYINFIVENEFEEYLFSVKKCFTIKELCEITNTDRRWWQRNIKKGNITAIKSPIKEYFINYSEAARVITDLIKPKDFGMNRMLNYQYEMKIKRLNNNCENAAQADLNRINKSIISANGKSEDPQKAFSNSKWTPLCNEVQVVSDNKEELLKQLKTEEEDIEQYSVDTEEDSIVEPDVQNYSEIVDEDIEDGEEFLKINDEKIKYTVKSSVEIVRNTNKDLAINLIQKIANLPIEEVDLDAGVACMEALLDSDQIIDFLMENLIDLEENKKES